MEQKLFEITTCAGFRNLIFGLVSYLFCFLCSGLESKFRPKIVYVQNWVGLRVLLTPQMMEYMHEENPPF